MKEIVAPLAPYFKSIVQACALNLQESDGLFYKNLKKNSEELFLDSWVFELLSSILLFAQKS